MQQCICINFYLYYFYLTSYRNAWQRVIADKGLKFDIKTDPEFQRSREVLKSKRKQLTNEGKGNKPNAARELEQDEVNVLYETGFFGTHEAVALQRTVWWKLSIQFGYRGVQESTKLQFGDVKLTCDNGKECLIWDTERGTKTRTGATRSHQHRFNPTAHVFDSVEASQPDSRFYLTPIPTTRLNKTANPDQKWYYASPMGKNSIGKMLRGAEKLIGQLKKTTT